MIRAQLLHNGQIIEGSFVDLGKWNITVWVDISDPTEDQLAEVAAYLGISTEQISELLHPKQRPILEDIGKFTAVVFQAPEIQNRTVLLKPHLLLASKEQQDFLTLYYGSSNVVEKINSFSPKHKVELFQRGSTALLFAVLGEIVGNSFDVLDYLGEEISRLEEQVFQPQLSSKVMERMFGVKKNLIYFQRALSSDREVVSEIEKAYGGFLDRKQLSQFRLLYADVTELIELATTYRDILISAVEVYLSAISNNLNMVVKRLTAWGAIILVPSLIAGIYGMNFLALPFAHHPYGFWYSLGAMVLSVWLLYAYFKRKDWI